MNKKKPIFSKSIQTASLYVLTFMALNIMKNLIFNFNSFIEIKNHFLISDKKLLLGFIVLATIILSWLFLSLIGGSIYFCIQNIKYHNIRKQKSEL